MMTFTGRAALLAAMLMAAPATGTETVDQVESLHVEAGESEFEYQLVWHGSDAGAPSAASHGFTLEHATADWLSVGAELHVAAAAAEALDAEAVSLFAKFVARDASEHAIGFGAQVELEQELHGAHGPELELLFIAETHGAHSSVVANLVLEGALSALEDAELGYAARADREMGEGWALGLEVGGVFGHYDDFDDMEDQAHWLGPVVAVEIGKVELELSYFTGLTDAAPDDQVRLEIGVAF